MQHPVAKCQNPECSEVFHCTGLAIENSRGVSFSGVGTNCPACGGKARILDGTFDFIGDTIRLLSGPQITIDVFTKLAQTIRDSVAAGEPADKTVERITEIAPWLSSLKTYAKGQIVNLVWCALSAVAGVAVSKAWDAQSASETREQQVQVVREGLMRDRGEQQWLEFQERMKEPLPDHQPATAEQKYRLFHHDGPLIGDAPQTMARLSEYRRNNSQRNR